MSQQCHKYFLQYSTFVSERPQFRSWWRQTCFLPREPSNLVTRLLQTANWFHILLHLIICSITKPPKVVTCSCSSRRSCKFFIKFLNERISPHLRIAWIADGTLRSVRWHRAESRKAQSLKRKDTFHGKTLTFYTQKWRNLCLPDRLRKKIVCTEKQYLRVAI